MSLEQFHPPIDADLWVTPHEQMHVVGQDFRFDQLLPPPLDLLDKDNLQPLIYWWRHHRTPVLRAEHHMIPEDGDDSVVAAYISHTGSLI
jgi:hypothetical protein